MKPKPSAKKRKAKLLPGVSGNHLDALDRPTVNADKSLPNYVYDVDFQMSDGLRQKLTFKQSASRRSNHGPFTVYAFTIQINGQNIIGWESKAARGFLAKSK